MLGNCGLLNYIRETELAGFWFMAIVMLFPGLKLKNSFIHLSKFCKQIP